MSSTQTMTTTATTTTINKYPNLGPKPVRASLNYVSPSAEVFYPGTAGAFRREQDPHEVQIADMRGRESEFTLDVQGFQPVMHETAMDDNDYSNSDAVKRIMYPDTEDLLRRHTGASKVVIYSHVVRTKCWQEGADITKDLDGDTPVPLPVPARFVHVDHSYAGALEVLNDNFPAEDAKQLGNKRWAIINVWRPIHYAAVRDPLAVSDARSIKESELKGVYARLPPKNSVGAFQQVSAGDGFETWHLRFSPEHKWYYWSDMQPGEALLLKIFDSKKSGGAARRSPHTAFQNEVTDGPPRNSVECRCLVFWDDQTSD